MVIHSPRQLSQLQHTVTFVTDSIFVSKNILHPVVNNTFAFFLNPLVCSNESLIDEEKKPRRNKNERKIAKVVIKI
jgi:hypothetical protein